MESLSRQDASSPAKVTFLGLERNMVLMLFVMRIDNNFEPARLMVSRNEEDSQSGTESRKVCIISTPLSQVDICLYSHSWRACGK